MSRFATKEDLLSDASSARERLDRLLSAMPDEAKLVVIDDGMTAKDFIAHRMEWGRMMLRWYSEAAAGGSPVVPAENHTWGTLRALNAEIYDRYVDASLHDLESEFRSVHDELFVVIADCSDAELFEKHFYDFTGTSDLATYFTSATGGHYRSAYKHINRWWRANKAAYSTE